MKRALVFIMVSAFIFSYMPKGFSATDEEIQALKQQVQELMQRIEKLESERTAAKEETAKTKEEVAKIKETTTTAQAPKVDVANVLSKLKIKGRWAAGFYKSETDGSFPSGSFEVPEAKLQFSFQPDDINTIVMRFNLNNATAQSPLLDYLYLQSKDYLPPLKNTPFSLSSRLGRFKLGFGEETWSNNPVESVLPSNSAGNVGVSDEGLEFAGKIKLDKIKLPPLGWVASISDGNSGVGFDPGQGKAFMGKIYYSPVDPLYLSTTYYNSGKLKRANAEMSVAGLSARPATATSWDREAWEVDARYDFGKGKKPLDPIVYSDSKAIVRLSYGQFNDDSIGAAERVGQFGFVEGIYNVTKKVYTAGRFSIVDLYGNTTALLNSVNSNKYLRYSLGLGYRWSENTILKFGYDWNRNSGPEINDAEDNLLSAIVASQF